jgi:capsular polysaccharide biosynthesis protein
VNPQVTDFRSHAATLRRRLHALVATAVVGLAAGVAFVILEPPALTSTTLVLLPTPALADSSNSDVATQVRIASSANILEQAGKAITPALSLRKVERMVKVSAPTNQLVQIDATSTNAAVAQTLSQAVSDAYVNYVRDTAREVTAAALADLTHRRDDLQAQIKQLQREIAATIKRQRALDSTSSEAREEAQLLAGLRTQQANLALQLDKVEDKIATGSPVGISAGAGTSVIQQATPATGLTTSIRMLVWAPVGALACTIVAAVIVLAAAQRDPRIRLRDDIADAIGSPVLAAIRSRPQRSVAGWSTLLETYRATPVESWALRQVLRGLVPADRKGQSRTAGRVDHPQSLTVASLSGDAKGLAIGPQLAAFASSLGIVTRLAPTVGHVRAPTLWAACANERDAPARPGLFVGNVPDGEKVDLTIFLVVVERTHPYLGDTPASAATILAVAAASATEQDLARVAVAVDDAGRRIDGIVVADPDHTDRTSGRHTMEERSRQLALPTRLTGMASADSAVGDRHRGHS